MTLPIERARSRRPITWLTLVGVILLPVVIGGLLVAALYNPTERLDALTAAVVNEDEAVEIDGQMVPLGRQLTAGLVEGSDEIESNLTWTISNPDDAEEGLADGTYAAVITIPENFSSAATSTQPGMEPEQAVIEVTTPPDSLIVDDAITAQIATTAASVMGEQLSTVYLENVLLGFTTLGDQLGEAADGAGQLADGAMTLTDGIDQYVSGVGQLADGAGQTATGTRQYVDGVGQLAAGAQQLVPGLGQLASGADQLASGGYEAADGVESLGAGARGIADGTSDLADGIDEIADATSIIPAIPQEIVDATQSVADNSAAISTQLTDSAAELAQLAADCPASGASPDTCATLTRLADDAAAALPGLTSVLDNSEQLASGVAQLQYFGPQITEGLRASASGARQLATGGYGIADGADEAATGVRDIAAGTAGLASGARQAATGAGQLATGAQTAADQGGLLADGAAQLAAGAQTAADQGGALVTGAGGVADGTDELASGLQTAVDEIPTYTDEEASDVATVVATPVAAEGVGTSLFGASAVPLLTVLALWFGGLGSFIALQAVPRSALASRRPSAVLALRALLPAAGIGALQGLLMAGVVQLAASYTWSEWGLFAALCVVAGVAFAAVNQALVAVFGGAGRWVAALVGVLTVATGVVSTVPGVISEVAALMPTAPAYNGMVAALTSTGGVRAAVAGLLIWSLAALAVTVFAVARRRSVSAQQLLAPSTALA